MNMQLDRLTRVPSRITNELFLEYKIFQSRFVKGKMKILFSDKPAWECSIKKGFQYTKHEITFGELATKNLKDYELIVPLTIQDLKYLNEARNLIINNPIPIPSMESLLLCDDKYLLNKTLMAKGFGSIIPRMEGALAYPYIVKKRIDEWGVNSHMITDIQQEHIFSDILANPEYFSQEVITGPFEYATHILFKDQKIVCSINIKYVFKSEIPIKGKDNPIYIKICRCPYLDVFSSILKVIGFDGLCCLNYKVVDNRPYILEINPRFGGSLSPFFFSFMKHIV